ncbi:hypothetical protein [Microcystis aeruginosa]|uniref:Programmed cell death antitoxin YdcD n=1 Tax=Microcystis aeruginosa NIES-3787 TaxID=2517782 RepID=A0A6H9FYI7_MICAE|nr:hypothetical protein [Microcystis aeruginosa]GCL48278.1 hypothetical protein NIES3787_39940 [Microcystis aeruginosa NIES-3787]
MISPQIIELEQKLRNFSFEDKQWLLEQLHKHLEVLKENVNRKQVKDLIMETLNEVQNMPDNCYHEVWQKFDDACVRISGNLEESDLL